MMKENRCLTFKCSLIEQIIFLTYDTELSNVFESLIASDIAQLFITLETIVTKFK